MKPETRAKYLQRFTKAIKVLDKHDFICVGEFMFEKNGKTHDLSATDLNWAIKNL